jgi:sulfur carrier protein
VEITVNGEQCQVPEATTVAQLLDRLGLAGKYVAVEVNQSVIPLALHAEARLQAGDTLEIVTLVGGG